MNKKTKVDSHKIESTPEKKKTVRKKPEKGSSKAELLPVPQETSNAIEVATVETKAIQPEQSPEPTQKATPKIPSTEEDEKAAPTENGIQEAISKEKLIDRQLELLWANGRKQLLVETPQAQHSARHK